MKRGDSLHLERGLERTSRRRSPLAERLKRFTVYVSRFTKYGLPSEPLAYILTNHPLEDSGRVPVARQSDRHSEGLRDWRLVPLPLPDYPNK